MAGRSGFLGGSRRKRRTQRKQSKQSKQHKQRTRHNRLKRQSGGCRCDRTYDPDDAKFITYAKCPKCQKRPAVYFYEAYEPNGFLSNFYVRMRNPGYKQAKSTEEFRDTFASGDGVIPFEYKGITCTNSEQGFCHSKAEHFEYPDEVLAKIAEIGNPFTIKDISSGAILLPKEDNGYFYVLNKEEKSYGKPTAPKIEEIKKRLKAENPDELEAIVSNLFLVKGEPVCIGKGKAGPAWAEWAATNYNVMLELQTAKFEPVGDDFEMCDLLMRTGINTIIAEAASEDGNWGIKFDAESADANKMNWEWNRLGDVLMDVRESLIRRYPERYCAILKA